MKITFKLNGFNFKRVEYTKAFAAALQLQLRNAAREFAREVLLRVPVQTGFARGALLNLDDAIGLNAATNPLAFRRKIDKKRGKVRNVPLNGSYEYYTDSGGRVLKTPENARQFSTPLGKVFTNNGFKYTFNYYVTILYYEINDVTSNRYTPSAPWGSFQAGQEAMLKYLQDNILRKVPAIKDFMVTTELR